MSRNTNQKLKNWFLERSRISDRVHKADTVYQFAPCLRGPILMPTRRQTLWGLGGAAVATVGGLSLLSNLRSHAGPSASSVQSSFKLPEILKGTRKGAETVYDLQLQTGTSNFLEGLKTETIGINQPYLGPLLEMQSGERVKLNVHNWSAPTKVVHYLS